MMVCLQSVWFKFKSALKGICAAFFPLRMKCKLKSLNRRYFAWYIQLNDFCKLSANTTAVLHVFLACWVSVHLMLHEVLLSFCFLICHYEWIHTSSPWRRRFLVASNRPPTWDRMWLFKVVAPVKDREQYPHLKGFLLTWMTACARNSQTLLKWAGQWPHW